MIVMSMMKLVGKQIKSLRFGLLPCVMLIVLTTKTFMSSGAVMLSGLCMAFLPYLSQVKAITCFEEEVADEKYLFSRYIMYLFFMIGGMFYLKGVTYLGSIFYPGYVESALADEFFLLTCLCNLVFISILVPLTYALNSRQNMLTAIILANVEIGFMFFAQKVLVILGDGFVLADQWGIYLLAVMLPFFAMAAILMGSQGSLNGQKLSVEK